MKLFRALWLTEDLEPDRDKLLRKGKRGKFRPDLYMVALSERSEDILDLLPAFQLAEPHFKKSDQLIIGMAGNREQAEELSAAIISRAVHETGSPDVRAYIARAEEVLT